MMMKQLNSEIIPSEVQQYYTSLYTTHFHPVSSKPQSELRKHRNLGNKFPEPMPVLGNQVITQGLNIQETLKLLCTYSKKDGILGEF